MRENIELKYRDRSGISKSWQQELRKYVYWKFRLIPEDKVDDIRCWPLKPLHIMALKELASASPESSQYRSFRVTAFETPIRSFWDTMYFCR